MARDRLTRVALLVDRAFPGLDEGVLGTLLSDWTAWAAGLGWALESPVVLFGARAGWVGRLDPASPSVRAIRAAAQPALGAAFERVAEAGWPDAIVVFLAGEPEAGWASTLAGRPTSTLSVVVTGPRLPAVVGQGQLGAPFRPEHAGLALRWVLCELRDRRRDVSEVLRVRTRDGGDRTIAWAPGAALFPHHRGEPLSFAAPLARYGGDVAALDAVIGPPPARRRSREAAPPLRAVPGRCAACDGAVDGTSLHVAPDPRWFCAACVASPYRCDFCGVPVGSGGGSRWPDGRKACPACWSSAVTDARELASLAAAAARWLERRMDMATPTCSLRFEHAAAIAAAHGGSFRPEPGPTPRPLGAFVRSGTLFGLDDARPLVFLEHGVPRAMAWGVVVHELVHSWQATHWARPDGSSPPRVLVEGLAMWVEYLALLDVGAIHAARLTERYGDPIYGLGFRIALACERKHGEAAVKHEMARLDPP